MKTLSKILVDGNGSESPVKEGDVIFVPSFENHGYRNQTSQDFVFLCVIPYLK